MALKHGLDTGRVSTIARLKTLKLMVLIQGTIRTSVMLLLVVQHTRGEKCQMLNWSVLMRTATLYTEQFTNIYFRKELFMKLLSVLLTACMLTACARNGSSPEPGEADPVSPKQPAF